MQWTSNKFTTSLGHHFHHSLDYCWMTIFLSYALPKSREKMHHVFAEHVSITHCLMPVDKQAASDIQIDAGRCRYLFLEVHITIDISIC